MRKYFVTHPFFLSTVIGLLFVVGCVPRYLSDYFDQREPRKLTVVRKNRPKIPKVYPVDENRFRYRFGDEVVWDALVKVIIENYELTHVKRELGVMMTDWDVFQSSGASLRNKIIIKLKKIDPMTTELIFNNETQRRSSGAWRAYPGTEALAEIGRIVTNVSHVLGGGSPKLPPTVAQSMRRLTKDEARGPL